MDKVNLHDLFTLSQNVMDASFNKSAGLNHPVDKGDNTEATWIEWFNKYFPRRYKANFIC